MGLIGTSRPARRYCSAAKPISKPEMQAQYPVAMTGQNRSARFRSAPPAAVKASATAAPTVTTGKTKRMSKSSSKTQLGIVTPRIRSRGITRWHISRRAGGSARAATQRAVSMGRPRAAAKSGADGLHVLVMLRLATHSVPRHGTSTCPMPAPCTGCLAGERRAPELGRPRTDAVADHHDPAAAGVADDRDAGAGYPPVTSAPSRLHPGTSSATRPCASARTLLPARCCPSLFTQAHTLDRAARNMPSCQ